MSIDYFMNKINPDTMVKNQKWINRKKYKSKFILSNMLFLEFNMVISMFIQKYLTGLFNTFLENS